MKKLIFIAAMFALVSVTSCQDQSIEPENTTTPAKESKIGYVQMELTYQDGTIERSRIMDIQK